MASFNQVNLIGNIGKISEMRKVAEAEKSVITLSIATSYKDKTTWHNVKVWGSSADYAVNYCSKGDTVLVSGYIENSKWTDTGGNDHYKTEIVATEFQKIK